MNVEPMSIGRPRTVARQNPCPDSDRCLKQLELSEIEVSATSAEPVAPGGTYEVAVVYRNHALAIFSTDPDRCDNDANLCQPTGSITPEGYCAITGLFPPGDGIPNQDIRQCVPMDPLNPPNIYRVRFTVQAPQTEGIHELSVNAQFEGSSQATPLFPAQVHVDSSGDDDSTLNGDGGGFNLIEWALNNPGQAIIAMVILLVFVSTFTSTATASITPG